MSDALVRQSSGDLIREMAARGEVHLPALREVHRSQHDSERTIYERDKTTYETVRETVEIYYFD